MHAAPDAAHLRAVQQQADCIHDAAAVEAALDRLATAITQTMAEQTPLLLGVMSGAVVPLGRLLPRLDFPLELDYIHASRYRGSTVGRDLVWLARPQTPLKGRHVLLVDDILDEGATLDGIMQECRDLGAASVRIAVLCEKRHSRRANGLVADFVGLEVPDRYVFGAGMDYRGYLRNANGLYAVPDALLE